MNKKPDNAQREMYTLKLKATTKAALRHWAVDNKASAGDAVDRLVELHLKDLTA